MSNNSKHSINPLFDYILVKPLKQDAVTASGIVIPDTAKEKPQIGEVMAVGPGAIDDQGKIIPMVVKVGDKVMYKKWGGNEVKVENEEWLIVEQKDVMATVK